MKILYVTSDAIPLPKGSSVRTLLTVQTLRGLGHKVEFFCPSEEMGSASSAGLADPPQSNFLARMMQVRRLVEEWLQGRTADAVQFRGIWEGVPALAWARRSGARAIFEAHGFPSSELPAHFPALLRHEIVLQKIIAEEQAILAASDLILAPSRTGARFLLMRGVEPNRIAVLPNAAEPTLFSPAPVPPPDEPPYRLVYVGTLAPWQGLPTLLEALAQFRNGLPMALHVVGPSRSAWRHQLLQHARRLRIRHLLNLSAPCAQADLVPVLRTGHVCVAPLPADPRNALQGCCPIKLLEYMAVGRPILSTRIPPVEELLEHGTTAYLATPGSPLGLVQGIAWMLTHPREREELGARARDALLANWTPDCFHRRLGEILDRLFRMCHSGRMEA
jgi:glycosyltransferase involved in cell wall biosynthesis